MPNRHCRAVAGGLLLAALLPLPALAQGVLLSHAERPVKLIRKTTIYEAPAGASLQPGDILASGASGAQLEWNNGALLALGPETAIQLDAPAAVPAVTLLRGWIKVAATKPANSQLGTTAGPLQLRAFRGSAILHLDGDRTEAFVEQGPLSLTETDKAGDPPQTVNRDQYVVRAGAQALQVMPRAPKPFVAGLPRQFYDPLVAIASRVKPAEAVAQHEAEVADVLALGGLSPLLRKRLAAQFAPRLSDPAFREAADARLADDADWRPLLQKTAKKPPPDKRPPGISNYVF